MNVSFKQLLSFVIVLFMVISMLPVNALDVLATENNGSEIATQQEAAVSGTITSCLVNVQDPAETYIASEIFDLKATESVVIKLYSGETQIATTTLLKPDYYVMSTLGVKIIITGDSSSWETKWAEGMPRADMVPDKVVLFVDGQEMNSANVPMTSTDGELPVDWATVPGVKPSEPQADLIISNAAELKAFAEAVNAGESYNGKLVVLAANIDLEGSETNLWTPIGANGDSSKKFYGTFDGKGYTISNLYVKQEAAYHSAGLFGAACGTIKNLTIDGAYVESLSSGSATVNGTAVLAGSTAYGATIDNVHVKNATVKGNRYVAGIVGYMDGSVTNCSVEDVTIIATPDNLTGSYDNGDKVGGIVGYCNSGATEISGCELKGEVNITAYRDVAGVVGCVQSKVVVSNNTNNAALSIVIDTTLCGERDSYNVGEFYGRNTPAAESAGNTTTETATYTSKVVTAPNCDRLSYGFTKEVDGYVRIWGEAYGCNAQESFVLKLYSGDELMATTQLNDVDNIIDGDIPEITWNFFYPESNDAYWTTTWEDGHPNSAAQPDKVELYVDGVLVKTNEVQMNGADNLFPVVWEELGGVENIVPELPTATVTPISNPDLSFALNFKVDEITEDQFNYYGDWYADFVLTINKDVTFNADGSADGYLSGQYDAWSENWVNVPFEDVTLPANTPLKIMEYAAGFMGKEDLKITYADVVLGVQDFDCGVFFTPEFLAANPDLDVTLELRMYNNENEEESYAIGETYDFTVPELPTATITETENGDLSFAMNFKADEITEEQLNYYGDWYADFVLTINKDVTFNADGSADGYLSGQYDAWSENWVNVPFEDVTLTANEPLKIMEFAAELMGKPGLKYTYKEVYQAVKDFNCGVYFSPEFLAANPDLEVTLELRMFNSADETDSYVIGDSYEFINDFVACNTVSKASFSDVSDALNAANAGETVILIKDVQDAYIAVYEDVTLDLNGYTLTADYVTCYGDLIDGSADNSGVLKVSERRFMIREDNAQLPVKNGEGYQFVELLGFNKAMMSSTKYAFQPLFEDAAHELLSKGGDTTGVTVQVLVSWTQGQGVRYQEFVYTDELVTGFIDSYNATTGKYSNMFTLSLAGVEEFEDLTFTAVVVSDAGVSYPAE